MTSGKDEKRRMIVPGEDVEELGPPKGGKVAFKKRGGMVGTARASSKDDLMEILEWNPKRTRKPVAVSGRETKEIWG